MNELQGYKIFRKRLEISENNFFEQNIETGLTKSHSSSRKKFPVIF